MASGAADDTAAGGDGEAAQSNDRWWAKRLDELEEPEDDEELSMERTFPPHPQPADIVTELLPFQREFLTWARLQEHSAARGGILADEMGLGKTLQAISLIVANRTDEILDDASCCTSVLAPHDHAGAGAGAGAGSSSSSAGSAALPASLAALVHRPARQYESEGVARERSLWEKARAKEEAKASKAAAAAEKRAAAKLQREEEREMLRMAKEIEKEEKAAAAGKAKASGAGSAAKAKPVKAAVAGAPEASSTAGGDSSASAAASASAAPASGIASTASAGAEGAESASSAVLTTAASVASPAGPVASPAPPAVSVASPLPKPGASSTPASTTAAKARTAASSGSAATSAAAGTASASGVSSGPGSTPASAAASGAGAAAATFKSDWKPLCDVESQLDRLAESPVPCKSTLVVCPVVALTQWRAEIQRHTRPGSLSVMIYHGAGRSTTPEELSKYDVVLTTFSVLQSEYSRMMEPTKTPCPWCGKPFLPSKLPVHLRYFCGPDAVKTDAQAKQERKREGGMAAFAERILRDGGAGAAAGAGAGAGAGAAGNASDDDAGPGSALQRSRSSPATSGARSSPGAAAAAAAGSSSSGGEGVITLDGSSDDSGEDDGIVVGGRGRGSAAASGAASGAGTGKTASAAAGDGDGDDGRTWRGAGAGAGSAATPVPAKKAGAAEGGPAKRGRPASASSSADAGAGEGKRSSSQPVKRARKSSASEGEAGKQRSGSKGKRKGKGGDSDFSGSDDSDSDFAADGSTSSDDSSDSDGSGLVAESSDDEAGGRGRKKAATTTRRPRAASAGAALSSGAASASAATPKPKAMKLGPVSVLHKIHWRRIIADEAHAMKNKRSATAQAAYRLTAERRWCLSGTPLQNRVGELFSLLRFLRFQPYCAYFCKNCPCTSLDYRFDEGGRHCEVCGHSPLRHYHWLMRLVLNPIKQFGYTGPGRDALMVLRKEVLDGILLRRTKASRAADLSLPGRAITVRNELELDAFEADFYQALYTQSRLKFDTYDSAGTVLSNYAMIFDLITRLRQAVDHPYLVLYGNSAVAAAAAASAGAGAGADAEAADLTDVCGICREAVEDPVVTGCRHTFCRLCMQEYLQSLGGTALSLLRDRTHDPDADVELMPEAEADDEDDDDDDDLGDDDSDGGGKRKKPKAKPKPKAAAGGAGAGARGESTPKGKAGAAGSAKKGGKGGKAGAGAADEDASPPATCPTCFAELTVDLTAGPSAITPAMASAAKRKSILARLPPDRVGGGFRSSTKIEALLADIWEAQSAEPGAKHIVFSQFVSMLDLVQHRLTHAGVRCVKMEGSMTVAARDRVIDAFRNDPHVNVFLVSLKAGGVALNLTAASHVHLLDSWWNAAAEMQAMDRTHRLGQHRTATVHRYFVRDSIEERVLALQQRKALVFEATVGQDTQAAAKLTAEDMRYLFGR